jgi:hypothetical protein
MESMFVQRSEYACTSQCSETRLLRNICRSTLQLSSSLGANTKNKSLLRPSLI